MHSLSLLEKKFNAYCEKYYELISDLISPATSLEMATDIIATHVVRTQNIKMERHDERDQINYVLSDETHNLLTIELYDSPSGPLLMSLSPAPAPHNPQQVTGIKALLSSSQTAPDTDRSD